MKNNSKISGMMMSNSENGSFSVIADYDINDEQFQNIQIDEVIPVLPLRNQVLFPGVLMPVSIGRKGSMKLLREAEKKKSFLACFARRTRRSTNPDLKTSIP